MAKLSAGLLMYRRHEGQVELFLVHPGGPFWAKKDARVWTIPKGELCEGEDPLQTARREFQEETGFVAEGEFASLGEVQQAGGKTVAAWCFEGDCKPEDLKSNSCQIEWPPRSGRKVEIPEVDRGAWFSLEEARVRLVPAQAAFTDRLQSLICEAG